jgi:hypothetical protein
MKERSDIPFRGHEGLVGTFLSLYVSELGHRGANYILRRTETS